MRAWAGLLLGLAWLLAGVQPALAVSLQVASTALQQGQPIMVRACGLAGAKEVALRFLEQRVDLLPGRDGCFYGLVAADLTTAKGTHPLRLLADGRQVAAVRLPVKAGDYGQRSITVDPKYLRLSPAQLRRHQREKALIDKVMASHTPRRLWAGGFARPLQGEVVSNFGRRTLINGQGRSPHSGVDLRASQGQPVRAAAAGRVALVLDTFFGGLSVLIDHGQGLISSYLHLSAAQVEQGQAVQRGQVIGRAGSSGRVTGPHLHFGLRCQGARVDPLAWVEQSRRLSVLLGEK